MMDGMERSSGNFINDAMKRKDCTDPNLIEDARRRGAIDRDIDDGNYRVEKVYRVVRIDLIGYSMSIPYKAKDGGIGCRKIHSEIIDFGGKKYRCVKDHQDRVIYIDTHALEGDIEKSRCRCGEGSCNRHGTEAKPPDHSG